MAFNYKSTFPAISTASIALGQTLAAAGNLNLNGTLKQTQIPNDGGTISFFPNQGKTAQNSSDMTVFGDFNVPITLTSTGALSGVNFTITGTLKTPYNPAFPVTEVLAGPDNSTVTSVNFYNRILSITASAAVGTTISVGTGSTNAYTVWLPLNGPGASSMAAIAAFVSASGINYTVQHTYDNVFNSAETINVFSIDDASMVGATTTQESNYAFSPRAVRLLINSSTTGSLVFYVNQSGLVGGI